MHYAGGKIMICKDCKKVCEKCGNKDMRSEEIPVIDSRVFFKDDFHAPEPTIIRNRSDAVHATDDEPGNIPRKEWIEKYPRKWEQYQDWIEKTRLKHGDVNVGEDKA